MELATAAGNEQAVTMNQQMLKLYQSQRPFHLPPQKGASHSPPQK